MVAACVTGCIMTETIIVKYYSVAEERINVLSHAFGLMLSLVGFVFLIIRSSENGTLSQVATFGIFGASLVVLYAASTAYHSAVVPRLRGRLRVIDHAAIYILIAGTYTPFTLVTLDGPIGWTLFCIAWGMALTGTILKLFFTGKYNLISTLMYVFMGWLMVFAIKPLVANLSHAGLLWLIAGGLSYTAGAIIYSIRSVKFNHAVFHLFVLVGSFCHFVSVFWYVLPTI